jgi:hypothetical protein
MVNISGCAMQGAGLSNAEVGMRNAENRKRCKGLGYGVRVYGHRAERIGHGA